MLSLWEAMVLSWLNDIYSHRGQKTTNEKVPWVEGEKWS
jgi:hypothetical protein